MTRPLFAGHPHLLGFDHLERLAERAAKPDSYPPFDIEALSPDVWRITLAVAGFGEDDLSITVEGRQLVVRGRKAGCAEDGRSYLHRGIAARRFERSFVLSEGVEVTGADLSRGLLALRVERAAPRPVVKTIPIAPAGGSAR